jgi:hypothetical protein
LDSERHVASPRKVPHLEAGGGRVQRWLALLLVSPRKEEHLQETAISFHR